MYVQHFCNNESHTMQTDPQRKKEIGENVKMLVI